VVRPVRKDIISNGMHIASPGRRWKTVVVPTTAKPFDKLKAGNPPKSGGKCRIFAKFMGIYEICGQNFTKVIDRRLFVEYNFAVFV